MINFQGKLTDANQTPVDGPTTILFSVYYTENGGTLLWSQDAKVTANKNIFNVPLGKGIPNQAGCPGV